MSNVARNVSTKLTTPQVNAIDSAAKAAGTRRGEAVRAALQAFCESHGIEWPEDANAWGGPRPIPPRKGRWKRRTRAEIEAERKAREAGG